MNILNFVKLKSDFMSQLDQIKKPIANHLKSFEKEFADSMKTSIPLLSRITKYLVKSKGKQMRPIFVFHSAGLLNKITPSTHTAATLIELLHTATLIHDDVVDDSYLRRGFFSINALWKNKAAVLIGDFLLSKGLLLALDNNEFELLKIVSTTTKEMSEGELLQLEKARNLDIKEDVYFEIIRKKTASLIASCCAAGAYSADASEEDVEKLRLFGENIGIAFQIKDDLFDYEKSNKTGKPSGIDIKEKKMTLPLIYLLNNSSASEKRQIISIVKRQKLKRFNELIAKVNEVGGIKYAEQKMFEYRDKALSILNEFDDSESKEALIQLVHFTIERKH